MRARRHAAATLLAGFLAGGLLAAGGLFASAGAQAPV